MWLTSGEAGLKVAGGHKIPDVPLRKSTEMLLVLGLVAKSVSVGTCTWLQNSGSWAPLDTRSGELVCTGKSILHMTGRGVTGRA